MSDKNDFRGVDETAAAEVPKYWGDVLAAFGQGLQFDLRTRLAIELLKSGLLTRPESWAEFANAEDKVFLRGGEHGTGQRVPVSPTHPARFIVGFALDVAEELVNQSQARGYSKPLPDTADLPAPLRLHIKRNAAAQVAGQVAMNEAAQEAAPRVGVARQ